MSNSITYIGLGSGSGSGSTVTPGSIANDDNTRRMRFRDGNLVIEDAITPLGFDGVENTDWEIVTTL